MMVDHVLYAVPMRYIDGNLVRRITDVPDVYSQQLYEYAKVNKGIGVGGAFEGRCYISNNVFCDFIKESIG